LFVNVSSDIIFICVGTPTKKFVNILFTSISPFVTGVLSVLISFFKPFALNSKATLPASLKVSSKESAISFVY
jgi:UDP-glucose 6-dehydrogenase